MTSRKDLTDLSKRLKELPGLNTEQKKGITSEVRSTKEAAKRGSRSPTAYNKFVKANWGRAQGTNSKEKMRNIARMWRNQ